MMKIFIVEFTITALMLIGVLWPVSLCNRAHIHTDIFWVEGETEKSYASPC